ncbi:ATPase, T2SS/T4P/T4SS family [Paraburkholderia largidicola]|uniref:Type IV pilus biosynthesis protein n=1 Tax=Paraburkholderia largidicola TaxID=3014751 RepID=A0A7I8C4L5_9BURK|nr:ATPase, T2SS/T4P/T4SS family [Paraburkholderia sp. PGU16]BCF95429.1 type IV pilus biosynthesis protein [Paraburkholderia sp. PGU16]
MLVNSKLPPLDDSLIDKIAIDFVDSVVYVEETLHWKPLFQTWLKRCERNGVKLDVKYAALDEVAALRSKGLRTVEKIEDDQVNLPKAMDLITTGADYNASDIHLMMRGEHTEIQFVIKGETRTYQMIGQTEGEELARAVYQGLAKTKAASWKPLEFQSAQIPDDVLPPDLGLASARIIRGPMYPVNKGGAFMTIRLQYSDTRPELRRKRKLHALPLPRKPAGDFALLEMGYTRSNVEKLGLLMSVPHGVIIVTGPTGSGKTTLLYEVMKEKARIRPGRRQITIEDPIELPYEWAVQLPVTDTRGDEENGDAFAERGQTALRMAPNTLMFGEARGANVAVEVIRGAQTGHDTWTTTHVSDPFQAIERWETLDPVRLNRKLFCDPVTLRGFVGVRLLPRLCKGCCVKLTDHLEDVPSRIVDALRTWGDIEGVNLRGPGCEACGFDSVTKREAVCEVVVNDEKLAHDLIHFDVSTARQNYRARPDADPSMLDESIRRVLAGLVDPRDVEDRVELISPRRTGEGERVVSLREASQEISRPRNIADPVESAEMMEAAAHA